MLDITPAGDEVGTEGSQADWLVGGGEMGKLVRSIDWTVTPLGPIETWPQSLRTTVSLCLASNFPISLVWGPKHIQIYNDGYWPICGGKHPHSMGQDFTECWASAWPVIGEAFARACAGETSYLENQRMFLDRNGYLEETFFTFSFSPIHDESGGVGGLFHPVTETTAKMVGERRTRALRDLAARAGKAQTTTDAFTLAAQTVAEFELDLPFALFYLLDAGATEARLIADAGALAAEVAMPRVDLTVADGSPWRLAEAARSGETQQVDGLEGRYGAFSCKPYPETPHTALALPIIPPGSDRPLAVLVAGVSPRLPLNDAYRAFYDLLAAAVTAAVANARAYEEERRRAEALAELDRTKTAFFSNVSHEFRTPLTLMLGPLEDELAEHASPLPPDRRERLGTAHRNTLRLLKLVNSLLDFSRIEAGRIHAHYQATDLAAYTAELASGFRSAVEKAGLSFQVDCPPLPEPVYVDRDMWEKIVLNLLSNAFKHTFKGSIGVALRWCDDSVELVVRDSGVGIAEAELPRLFDRFHRVQGTKSRTHEGTGIGLALVQELTRAHGGTVQVESREGEGTTFTVILKRGRAHLPADRLEVPPADRSFPMQVLAYTEEARRWSGNGSTDAAVESAGVRPHIIWADDNADMRDYVRRLLADQYDVTAVSDGAAALVAARATLPDLVLTDVMMPELDGFGLLRELRTDERTRTVPVILLSARAGEEAAVEGLDAGADDYLVKPFAARELLARVRTHLELGQLRRQWTAELELRSNERRFGALVQHGADMISVVDADGITTYVAPSVQEILGYRPDELAGRPARELLHPSDAPPGLGADLDARPGATSRGQYRLRHKDGTWRWMEGTAVNLLNDPDVRGVVINQRDITERRQIEEQARHAQKLDAIGQLAGGVAHDFNNMLGVILGICEVSDPTHASPVEVRRDLAEIRSAAERAATVTRQLLAFSRRQVLVPRIVDLNEYIRSMSTLLRRLIGETIRVTEELAPDLGRTLVDPGQIEQVIVNLAVNARDAMPEGGVLRLETRNVELDANYAREHADVTPGRYVALVVSDTGIGMDANTRARLFEPFFTTKDRGRGTGLGLAMVHGVVRQSGGHIWVYSEPGKGTTFRLYLPRTDEQTKVERTGGTEADAYPCGTETILVVEDDDSLRRVAVRVLSSHGYHTLEASGGEEALLIVEAHPDIALMLTDVIMPGLSGSALVARLQVLNPSIKTIFTSGYTNDEIAQHGVLETGVHFLQKPVSMTTLLRQVRNVLDLPAA